jgi:hypothetical protein
LFVEAIMALVRLSETKEVVVSDLARTILTLVEELRDTSLRAEMAEAALEAEVQKVDDIRDKLASWQGDDPHDMFRLLREVAEVVSA